MQNSQNLDLADDPDLALSIPLKALYEEYCCPICFNTVKDCRMTTPCGHNFCSKCIEECLNRKHACPSCNQPTSAAQLVKNLAFDRVVNIIVAEKEIASKKYFEKLIRQEPEANPVVEPASKKAAFSPIEEIFHKHMKKSLMSYEEYYKELEKKYIETEAKIQQEYAWKIAQTTDPSQQSQLSIKSKEELSKMQQSFKETVDSLLKAYEKYLAEVVPAPSFLPITTVVYIEDKNITLKKVVLKPTETAQDIKEMVQKKLLELGDPLQAYSGDNIFWIKDLSGSERIITNELKPLREYNVMQGETIVLKGKLRTKSDLPKQCFSTTFDKSKENVMDYYTCKDCKFNWICKPCAESCHKGHNITEYISNHHPTWACCYCVKNKKCTIVKIK